MLITLQTEQNENHGSAGVGMDRGVMVGGVLVSASILIAVLLLTSEPDSTAAPRVGPARDCQTTLMSGEPERRCDAAPTAAGRETDVCAH